MGLARLSSAQDRGLHSHPLSETLPQGCSHMGTCGPSRASAPPLATGPSRVAHVPPPHIPPPPAQVPPCPQPSPLGGEQSPRHTHSLSVTHVTHLHPSHTSNCVRVEGRAALICCHRHHQGQGCCPCGTHLLSQFPIWDRDTAPSTVPCLCLCRLFGNLFSPFPHSPSSAPLEGSCVGAQLQQSWKTPQEKGCALLHGS